ncbi:hypothetical protein [Maribacter hydrothermalis]|uniref:Uncharacterized protein n=1 Tax=Maribacter hydrothermalis TaxID=1836467 RepID=A0A1B7ZFE1_9FLAO|nr:hypothetical protein [Maribacter hydrothermalis]APQ17779.1 hypothetical protein BTR34_10755 [Maribacter hydrothermalis]OBR42253.1 hypothetical protein A9200_02375 [Maribacter hydrothermalis]
MTHSGSEKGTHPFLRVYQSLLAEFKREQTGYASIAIIGQSCLGSAAAMVLLMSGVDQVMNLILLFLVTILCMAFNGAVLAQLSSKITFNLLILTVLFSSVVIVAHLF